VRVEWIGSDITVLLDADRIPFAKRDCAIVAATGRSDRPALLLAAVYPIRYLVVGDHVVELRSGLVVPRAPRFSAVDGDRRTLIGREEHDVRIVGIDPNAMVVVTAGRALDRSERLATVHRAICRRVSRIDDVRISRIHLDLG